MTTEKNLWLRVKKNLPHDCYATRIENRMGGGVPDVHVIWNGLAFWIELKITKDNKIRLSSNQIAWNTAYSGSGGLSFILVKHLSSGDLILFRGARALDVAKSGLAAGAEFRGSGFGDLWDAVREAVDRHLEAVLAGLRDSGSGFGDLAQGHPGTGAPVLGSQQPRLEAKEKEA